MADDSLSRRLKLTGVILVVFNAGTWLWALERFRLQPVLLGTAGLAYLLGLRHAVDADHIAAIDNVTRRMMHAGRRPAAVGFFFALGHSTIVLGLTAAVAATSVTLQGRWPQCAAWAGRFGTAVSGGFLLVIAAANAKVLAGIWRRWRRGASGASLAADSPPGGGLATRLGRPLFRLIERSWQMYPLGFLFGLGFDTATEVALVALAARGAVAGLAPASLLVFPLLFAAGMTLIDTADGWLMLLAYRRALSDPARTLGYNLAVTAASVAVAVLIGGAELAGLAGEAGRAGGRLWTGIRALEDHLEAAGCAIAGLFFLAWLAAEVRRSTRWNLPAAD